MQGRLTLVLCVMALIVYWALGTPAPAAIPPAPIDSAFQAGNEKDVTIAIIESEVFKKAIKEAVKARDVRKGEIGADPSKSLGISPSQAARVRFIQVLQGK